MNDVKDLKKSLPDMENTFVISIEGQVTKKKFEGTFTSKIPNVKTQAQIDKYRALLNAGLESSLDSGTQNVHHMVSYLRYTLLESPKWWEESDGGFDLYDVNVIKSVYDKVLDFEKSWLEEIWGKEEEEPKKSEEKKKDGAQKRK